MRFLYRFFLTLSLLGLAFTILRARQAFTGPGIDFDETIGQAMLGCFFSFTCGLFTLMFAKFYEAGRDRRR